MAATDAPIAPDSTKTPVSTTGTKSTTSAGTPALTVNAGAETPSWIDPAALAAAVAAKAESEATALAEARAAATPKSAADYRLAPLPAGMELLPEQSMTVRQAAHAEQLTQGEFSAFALAISRSFHDSAIKAPIAVYTERCEQYLRRVHGDRMDDVVAGAQRQLSRLIRANPWFGNLPEHALSNPQFISLLHELDQRRHGT